MKILNIEATDETPQIKFTGENGVFEITGRSLPEDVNEFFSPVMEWLDEFGENPFDLEMRINMEYFNTASSKIILDIFMKLDDIKCQNDHCNLLVRWYYDERDEDMMEAGEEYRELIDELEFVLEPIN